MKESGNYPATAVAATTAKDDIIKMLNDLEAYSGDLVVRMDDKLSCVAYAVDPAIKPDNNVQVGMPPLFSEMRKVIENTKHNLDLMNDLIARVGL